MKQKELITLVATMEGILFLITLVWGYFGKINPFLAIQFNLTDIILAFIATAILIGLNFLAVNILSKFIPFFRSLKSIYAELAEIAINISLPGALIVAIISGFVEEFFFRGILQEQFGLIIASIVFGLFHIGNSKTLSYGIYTILIGFYLGWLYISTGNLLVPITVHCLNNFLAFPYMRYYYNKYVKEKTD